jgi:hypothetical protein
MRLGAGEPSEFPASDRPQVGEFECSAVTELEDDLDTATPVQLGERLYMGVRPRHGDLGRFAITRRRPHASSERACDESKGTRPPPLLQDDPLRGAVPTDVTLESSAAGMPTA